MGRKLTQEQFIKRANVLHNGRYDYSKTNYINSNTQVIIICQEHGGFLQKPNDHIHDKNGCPKCSGLKRLTTEEFIEKANLKHNFKYDYSKTNYINSNTKVIIICQEHGEFKQIAGQHINAGTHCPKCGTNIRTLKNRSTTENFINDSNKIHNFIYDYSKTNYVTAHIDIIIICKIHGEFNQRPCSHLNGHGCSLCGYDKHSRETALKHKNEFIDKANIKHNFKYDYSKSLYGYINTNSNVLIICKLHGEFLQNVSSHLQGHGCKICGGCFVSNTNQFIEKSNEIHNFKYDYSKSKYLKNNKKMTIICKKHGNFLQSSSDHLSGRGCQKCGIESRLLIRTSNTEDFINSAIKIHFDKYDYSKVNYVKSYMHVLLICKIHGEFLQAPHKHLSGQGCGKCGNILNGLNSRSSTEEFIDKANKKHNFMYDYSQSLYIGAQEKIKVICKTHGEWFPKCNNHLNGSGCPRCFSPQCSKVQIVWLNFMQSYYNINIQHFNNICEYRIPNSLYKADGYCEETNTIYEFHGDFWHGNPKSFNPTAMNKTSKKTFGELYENTQKKEKFIRDSGYNLVVMWELQWMSFIKFIIKTQRKYKK